MAPPLTPAEFLVLHAVHVFVPIVEIAFFVTDVLICLWNVWVTVAVTTLLILVDLVITLVLLVGQIPRFVILDCVIFGVFIGCTRIAINWRKEYRRTADVRTLVCLSLDKTLLLHADHGLVVHDVNAMIRMYLTYAPA